LYPSTPNGWTSGNDDAYNDDNNDDD